MDRALSGETVHFEIEAKDKLSLNLQDVTYRAIPSTGGAEITVVTLNHYINNTLTILHNKIMHAQKTAVLEAVQNDLKAMDQSMRKVVSILQSLKEYKTFEIEDYFEDLKYFKIEE
ncbi:MAG: hypothetical protein HOE90_22595 [Bacteriovoracaceae bacterium]|nr:hypothetical protein [Bacteriovoracaceae bacterium]